MGSMRTSVGFCSKSIVEDTEDITSGEETTVSTGVFISGQMSFIQLRLKLTAQ